MTHIFIINPFAGAKYFAANLRSKLENIPNLRFFVFNTRHAGYEREVIKRIRHLFNDEKIRFYCCGGSGTFRNMLSGFDDFENVEIAFIPHGLSNDFLKVFGEEEEKFSNVEDMVNGEIVYLDYIKTNNGVAMNTCSLGMDLEVCLKNQDYRVLTPFSRQIPYTLSLLHALLFTKPQEYEIEVNGEKIVQKSTELVFCNGSTFGGNLHFVERADITDGMGELFVSAGLNLGKRISVVKSLVSADYEGVSKKMPKRTTNLLKIRRTDGKPFVINMDGELEQEAKEWECEIVRKGLPFVVPKGLKFFKEQK